MFGFSKAAPPTDPQREAAIEESKKFIKARLVEMHDASPQEAERLNELIKARCADDKNLPFDFKQKAYKRARELQCMANMRAADKVMHLALRLAAQENMKERTAKIGEARGYFSKACGLGASEDWRKAFQRLNENIMMTGGVQHKGPTRAKPDFHTPTNPNRAKA